MMGRTNIVLDSKLIKRVMVLTGARTKREAVDIALRRLVQQKTAAEKLLALRGKVEGDWDIRAWRKDKR